MYTKRKSKRHKTQASNRENESRLERRHFVEFNLNQAQDLVRNAPPGHVLLVLGLSCPMARTIATIVNGGTLPDLYGMPRGANPTIWAYADREAAIDLYRGFGNTSQTVAALQSGSRTIVFTAFGGSSVAELQNVQVAS
jgi:hypothetical protein